MGNYFFLNNPRAQMVFHFIIPPSMLQGLRLIMLLLKVGEKRKHTVILGSGKSGGSAGECDSQLCTYLNSLCYQHSKIYHLFSFGAVICKYGDNINDDSKELIKL